MSPSRSGTGRTGHHPGKRAQRRQATDTGGGREIDGGLPRSRDRSTGTSLSSLSAEPSQCLAAEHELLLRAVSVRADHVLATLAAARWPEQELAELIRYLQTEVIRQTRMEEQLLFVRTGGPSDAEFTRLARDHVTIRYALEALTDAARGCDHRDRRLLTTTVRNLVTHLAEHLRQERAVLSRHATDVGWQRALAAMENAPHARYPLIHAPVVDLDAFSPNQVFETIGPRIQRLRPDEQIVLVSGRDLRALCTRLLRDQNVAVHYLDDGPQTWCVSVCRRRLQ
jgi:hemerythrin-like domain-containing protein